MQNILISMKKPATPELLDAILVALASGWGDATAEVAGNTTVISFGGSDIEVAPETVPELPAFSDDCAVAVPDPMADMVAVASIAPAEFVPDAPLAAAPEVTPTTASLPNAIIKSLSLTTQVHTVYDTMLPTSTLKVGEVGEVGDLLVFMFGGMEYKYPMVDHKINVVISFTGKETEQFSCTLAVVATDTQEELVLGQDVSPSLTGYIS